MKATELMIGDWVAQKHGGLLLNVSEVRPPYIIADGEDGQFHEDTLEPIPLTEEILLANGFYYERNIGYVYEDDEYEVIVDLWNNSYRILYNRDVMMNIQCFSNVFVHELQHALRHCDVDKEITIKED